MEDTTCIDPNIVPKLLEVIALVLKREKTRSKPLRDIFTFDISSFLKKSHTLKRQSVSLINECLLSHRFEEAAKLLWVLSQDRSCFDVVLYRGVMVVLENLMPSDINVIVEKFSSAARQMKYVNRWEIQLEYLIYVLKNDIYSPGSSKLLEKGQKGNFKPIPLLHDIYSAYCALLNYKKWVNVSQGDPFTSDNKDFAFSIISSFKKLIDQPGVWDIFVLKLIEMLEHYEEYEELEDILKKYVESNPEHINAYIYLCLHLYKHKPDSEIFIKYAEVLANLCPSDERVLLLVQTWEKLSKELRKRLKILFYFLDYPANRKNIQAWEMLSSHLSDAALRRKYNSVGIDSFWRLRCHSWKYIHFVSSNINSEDDNMKLSLYKVKVLTIVEPHNEYIQKAELRFPGISKFASHNEIPEKESEDLNSFNSFLDR